MLYKLYFGGGGGGGGRLGGGGGGGDDAPLKLVFSNYFVVGSVGRWDSSF